MGQFAAYQVGKLIGRLRWFVQLVLIVPEEELFFISRAQETFEGLLIGVRAAVQCIVQVQALEGDLRSIWARMGLRSIPERREYHEWLLDLGVLGPDTNGTAGCR